MVRIGEWFEVARQGSVVRRGLGYAVVVGAVLISVNHGDAILAGDVSGGRAVKMVLTMMVPYVVSTLSSVGAMMKQEARDA